MLPKLYFFFYFLFLIIFIFLAKFTDSNFGKNVEFRLICQHKSNLSGGGVNYVSSSFLKFLLWVAAAVLPVIFQKGVLHSNKYFQILLINTILTIMKIFEEYLHMKIFGEGEDRTLDHQLGSQTSKPLGYAAIS